MATITLENVPESIQKKIWKRADFSKIVWIYWDWMDWCQYDEVIPSEEDISSFNNKDIDLSENDWEKF